MASFVPVGVVAFAGARRGCSPAPVFTALSAVLGAGHSVSVGCQNGVDSVVRFNTPADLLTVFSVNRFPELSARSALAARTVACVRSSNCLLAFPASGGVLGRGTGLAVRTAVSGGLPVFVAGSVRPVGAGWSASSFAGVSGWAFSPVVQGSLF